MEIVNPVIRVNDDKRYQTYIMTLLAALAIRTRFRESKALLIRIGKSLKATRSSMQITVTHSNRRRAFW